MSATTSNRTDTCRVVSANEVSAGINEMTNDAVRSKEKKTNSLPCVSKSEPFESHPERKKNKRKTKPDSEEIGDLVISSVIIDCNEQITHNDFEIVEKRKKRKKKTVDKDDSSYTESVSIGITDGGSHSDNVIPTVNTENYNKTHSIGAAATFDDTSNSSKRVSKKKRKKLKLPSDTYVTVIPADDDVANNDETVDIEASNAVEATYTTAENVKYNQDCVTDTLTVSIDDDSNASVGQWKTKKKGRDRKNVTSVSESHLEVTAETKLEGSTVSTSNTRERERTENKKKRKLASDDDDDYTRISKSKRTELPTGSKF